MKHLLTASIVALGLALSACTETSVVGDTPSSAVPATIPAFIVTAQSDDYVRPSTPEARAEAFATRSEFRLALRQAMAEAQGWRDANSRVRALLTQHPNVPDFEKEQLAATSMLTGYLLVGEAERAPEQLAAIGFYTEMLVSNRNPNATLIDASLEEMEGHWTREIISRMAESAYLASERLIQAKTGCEGCSAAEARVAGTNSDNQLVQQSLEDAFTGIERLSQRF